MKDKALILFTRVPLPGQTKTRLMPFLTAEECVGLHTVFLKDILQKVQQVDAALFVFYTPRDQEALLKQVIGQQIPCMPQTGEDLGQRMKHAIGSVLRQGFQRVVLMGTDIPQICPETIEQAFDSLQNSEIVINPTLDGGYYLIGMKQEYDSIWQIERYGTNTVIRDTLQHLEREQLRTAVGPRYYDVDEKEDLSRLYDEMKNKTVCNCPHTQAYLCGELAEKLEACNE